MTRAHDYDDKLMDIEVALYNLKQARVRFREFASTLTVPTEEQAHKERTQLFNEWSEKQTLFFAAVEKLKDK